MPESTKGLKAITVTLLVTETINFLLLLIYEPIYLGKFQSKDGSCFGFFDKVYFHFDETKVCDLQTNVTLITDT